VAPFSSDNSNAKDAPALISLDTTTHSGMAMLTMQNAPVNSLSLEMCQALSGAIKDAESDRSIQTLVLKSSKPTIFSAGLDILEMKEPQLDRLKKFWSSFQQLYVDLYGSRLACIASIQGHAPAAGCMLALSCDYRIMSASSESSAPTIGLNESKLGIVAPPWLGQQFIDTIGRRRAEKALTLGTLFTPEQALAMDLVDEVVPADQVEERAVEAAHEWAKIPPAARVASKMLIRQDRLNDMKAKRQADLDHFVGFVTNEKTQASLKAYLELLASKGRKK